MQEAQPGPKPKRSRLGPDIVVRAGAAAAETCFRKAPEPPQPSPQLLRSGVPSRALVHALPAGGWLRQRHVRSYTLRCSPARALLCAATPVLQRELNSCEAERQSKALLLLFKGLQDGSVGQVIM